jgi:predicted ATPase
LSGFHELGQASDEQLKESLSRLQRVGLISDAAADSRLDTHPLISEYFGKKFRSENECGWRQANEKLFDFLCRTSATVPVTLEEIEPLLLAVVHGCRSGKFRQALNEVFVARIMRGDQAYASAQLGLVGPLLTVLMHFFEARDWTKPILRSAANPQGLDPEDQVYVLNQVGYLLTALKGYAFPDVENVYTAAERACSEISNVDALFQVKYGLWRFHSGKGNLDKSIRNGEELLELARKGDSSTFAVVAHRALATSLYRLAHFRESLDHARAGIPLTVPQFPAYLGDDPTINCECFAAMSLWHLGFPEQAKTMQTQALENARKRASAHGLAVALYLASYLHDFLREYADSLTISERMIELASEYGFRWWLAAGSIRRGWASSMLGDPDRGMEDMREGIDLWRASGAVIGFPYWNGLLAEVQIKKGEYSEARKLIEEALITVNDTDERWWEPELYRLRAEILLAQGVSEQEATDSLLRSLKISKLTGDKALELRSAITLSGYWRGIGKSEGGLRLLRETMDQFSEGFESIDLMHAAELGRSFDLS